MSSATHTDTWLKAAVVGSLWGASEIVLGSFLHNLKIPFSGNLLTAIGIVLMIAGHRRWPQSGLVLRAGIICAALKTLSPSANIFGPMLAIMMQAVLMETALLIGRKTWFAYLLGGGMAMAWNIAHRILTSVIIYGGSLIEIYKRLIDYLVAQTGWQVEGYMKPVLIITGVFFLTGMAAAVAGIYISNVAKKTRDRQLADTMGKVEVEVEVEVEVKVQHPASLLRPIAILFMLTAGLIAISRLPLYAAAGLLFLFLIVVLFNDARLIKRFAAKLGFWVSMGLMLILSGFLLGRDNNEASFSMAGLQAGLEMMMRAIYVITGFGLISKELRKQDLVAWFKSRHLKSLLMAIHISFQTTPLLIESIPGKQAWRKPLNVLTGLIAGMEEALENMNKAINDQADQGSTASPTLETTEENKPNGEKPCFQQVFIITGTKGSGKSTTLRQVVQDQKDKGNDVCGILAPELVENGERIGYYVEDIKRGHRMVLCRKGEGARERRAESGYVFDPKAIAFGETVLKINRKDRHVLRHVSQRNGFFALLRASLCVPLRLKKKILRLKKQIIVIDELGPFELRGEGWAKAMDYLIANYSGSMIWVVRESLIHDMLQRWPAQSHQVFDVREQSAQTIANNIMATLYDENI